MNKDPVMIDLDNYLRRQEPDFRDQSETDEEIAERAADDACSTFKESDND